jgi:opacity protein-like surface antigen
MKKILLALVAIMALVANSANAQPANAETANADTANAPKVGEESLMAFKESHLEKLPYWVQGYVADDGTVLKAANATGWGVEIFAGYDFGKTYNTPEGGLSVRYDAKKVSYRLSGTVLSRQHNDEAVNPGKRYYAYAADAALHYNIFTDPRGFRQNFVSMYASIGYMYDRHKIQVAEDEISENETLIKYVSHRGSGLKFGGGLEYTHKFFATGNSAFVRIEIEYTQDAWVNNTKGALSFGIKCGANLGFNRRKVTFKY